MAIIPNSITLKFDKDRVKKYMLKLFKEDDDVRSAIIKIIVEDAMRSGVTRDIVRAALR